MAKLALLPPWSPSVSLLDATAGEPSLGPAGVARAIFTKL
jgi:hypothetical protein